MSIDAEPGRPGMDGPVSDALLRSRRYFTKATVSDDLRSLHARGGRGADVHLRS